MVKAALWFREGEFLGANLRRVEIDMPQLRGTMVLPALSFDVEEVDVRLPLVGEPGCLR